jgi:hypothetical protein
MLDPVRIAGIVGCVLLAAYGLYGLYWRYRQNWTKDCFVCHHPLHWDDAEPFDFLSPYDICKDKEACGTRWLGRIRKHA